VWWDMKQVIYIDILIAVNLFINYFLLASTAKFLCLKWKTRRLVLGEILGAVYSLYILLPELNLFFSIVIKLFMSITIILATFGIKNIKTFVKTLVCFYSVNFAFSGIMFAAWCVFHPNGMAINNGVVYFNISPVMLIFSTLVSYIIIEFINRVIGKKTNQARWCDVNIKLEGKSTVLKAKVDTGNSLKEPFSDLPVIVARQSSVAALLPNDMLFSATDRSKANTDVFQNLKYKIRMVPFKTVSGDGLFPAFKPSSISIAGGPEKEAYIAICPNKTLPEETSALINPDLID
jgi:stage II sporulation protein GA (sporulation sigma-E factor processing peptidase)